MGYNAITNLKTKMQKLVVSLCIYTSINNNLKAKFTYQYSNQGKILLIPKCTSLNLLFSVCLLVATSDNLFHKYVTYL